MGALKGAVAAGVGMAMVRTGRAKVAMGSNCAAPVANGGTDVGAVGEIVLSGSPAQADKIITPMAVASR